MMTRKSSFIALVCLVTLLGLVSLAGAANEVFLSNDTAQSEATYVIQFDMNAAGRVQQIHVTLPPGTFPAVPQLGQVFIGTDVVNGADIFPVGPDAAIVAFQARRVAVGTRIRLELFDLTNPLEGSYTTEVTALEAAGSPLG